MLILPPWIALNQTLLQWSSTQIADATYMAMVQALTDLPESFTAYEMVYHVNDAFAPQVPRILESHWNDFKRHSSASAEPVMDVCCETETA